VKLFLANAQYRDRILNQTLMRAFLRLDPSKNLVIFADF
jgi:hypothetical protein